MTGPALTPRDTADVLRLVRHLVRRCSGWCNPALCRTGEPHNPPATRMLVAPRLGELPRRQVAESICDECADAYLANPRPGEVPLEVEDVALAATVRRLVKAGLL